MKVLIVTETLNEGGAELFVLRLARALLFKGGQVQVLSLNKKDENSEMTKKFADVPIKRLSLPFLQVIGIVDKMLIRIGIDFSIKYYLQGKKLKRILNQFDIVHSNYIQADYLIASIKKPISFKHVVTVHGDYSSHYDKFRKGQLRLWLQLDKKLTFLAGSVDQWVILSEEHRFFFDTVMKVQQSKIEKIYNGFTELIKGDSITKESGVFTIGMVARGTEKKGWKVLIDTFLKMPENAKLLLVGGSSYLDELKAMYAVNTRIVFTGFQSEPLQWMRKMDVFVLPTLYPYESLPSVVAEALYSGLPVIATNVGEIENMITDEKTGDKAGFVIDFDGVSVNENQLLDKLIFLYQHPTIRKQMQDIAIKAFQKFDMNKCAAAYLQVYSKL